MLIYSTAALKAVKVQSLQNEHIVITLRRCESGHGAFCCHLSELLKWVPGDGTELLNAVAGLISIQDLLKQLLPLLLYS